MEDSERKLRGPVDLMQVHNLVDVDTHLPTLREWKQAVITPVEAAMRERIAAALPA
jgi:hypothetical protein